MFRLRRIEATCPLTQRALKELDKECFPADAPCEPEKGFWWLLWHGDKVAGYCALRNSYQHPGKYAYLCRAGVMPEYRGRGLQRRLIQARVTFARIRGWKECISDTARYNVASSNSLIRCGFKLYRPAEPWGFTNALYWYRKL